nr:hypothetical protein BaRGS_004135 [Batillaria attramentaria]
MEGQDPPDVVSSEHMLPGKSRKRSFLKRHKFKSMSGNGYPNILPEHLEVDGSSTGSTFAASVDSRHLGLSPHADKTYTDMLHNRLTNNSSASRIHSKNSLQSRIYNFLERPTGWKCFIYHFTV